MVTLREAGIIPYNGQTHNQNSSCGYPVELKHSN